MKIRKCDRCGKEMTVTETMRFYEAYGSNNIDLCHDCLIEFDKFFEGKEIKALKKG